MRRLSGSSGRPAESRGQSDKHRQLAFMDAGPAAAIIRYGPAARSSQWKPRKWSVTTECEAGNPVWTFIGREPEWTQGADCVEKLHCRLVFLLIHFLS